MRTVQTVKKIAYHRNGVFGEPFYVAIVNEEDEARLVIRFGNRKFDRENGSIFCAAFSLPQLAEGIIEFGENSFRGDYFVETVDNAIAEYKKTY